MANIESGVWGCSLSEMLQHEAGKGDYRKITDIQLCTELNEIAVQRFHKASVYALSESERDALANDLNTASAITLVYDLLKENVSDSTKISIIKEFDKVLSLDLLVEENISIDSDLEKYILEKIEEFHLRCD